MFVELCFFFLLYAYSVGVHIKATLVKYIYIYIYIFCLIIASNGKSLFKHSIHHYTPKNNQ